MENVYAKIDSAGRVLAIDGGYTENNVMRERDAWTLIDAGEGDRYTLCQSNYLPGPVFDEYGVALYKYDGTAVVDRTAAEIAADRAALPPEPVSDLERIAAQALYTAVVTDTLLEG